MNWLAHLYLSGDDPGVRIGNLVADLVKGPARRALGPPLCHGIAHHQRIDAFTDFHALFHRSKRRVPAGYERFAGILVDIFYDHLLAHFWAAHSPVPLDTFTAQVYGTFSTFYPELPAETCVLLARMARQDWLGSYRTVEGITDVLRRLSLRIAGRIGWNPHLEAAAAALAADREGFTEDFDAFFPELRRAAAGWLDASTPTVTVG